VRCAGRAPEHHDGQLAVALAQTGDELGTLQARRKYASLPDRPSGD
jgi:hypothetical protein